MGLTCGTREKAAPFAASCAKRSEGRTHQVRASYHEARHAGDEADERRRVTRVGEADGEEHDALECNKQAVPALLGLDAVPGGHALV